MAIVLGINSLVCQMEIKVPPTIWRPYWILVKSRWEVIIGQIDINRDRIISSKRKTEEVTRFTRKIYEFFWAVRTFNRNPASNPFDDVFPGFVIRLEI